MFIVMLGAAFFSGIRSAKNDMHVSADSYYDRVNFMDIRVVSTLGLTEDDLEDMRNTEGVAAVTGGYTAEVLNEQSDMEFALKVIAWTEDVNQVTLTDGRLPEKANECLADDIYLQQTGCEIGDQITLESGSPEDLSDTLKEETYTIVGSGTLPYYMEMDRGSGTVGDGSLDAFLVVLPEVFEQQDVYTEAYVQAEGAEAENSFDGAYETKVAEVVAGLEETADGACDRRYETIYQDGMEEIEDAKQEVADAEQELADAKAQIDDGEQQITDAKETLADGEKELEDGESELASREQQLAEARELLESKEAELNSGKSQLADGEQQIADAEAVLSAKEKELADGKAQLEAEAQQLEAGKAEIEEQSESLESGKAQVEEKARELEEAKAQVEAKAQELENGRAQLEAGRAELESGKAELEQNRQTVTAARQELEAKRADYETAKTALQQIEAQLGELQQQLTQTEEQIRQMEEALADAGLDTSPEYEALLAVKTQV